MRTSLLASAILTLVALITGSTSAAGEALPYFAGAAAHNVSPDYPIRLNGFAVRKKESEGISQPIWAKALAIRHAAAPPEASVVIVTLDNLGIRLSMVDEVARRVSSKTGVSRHQIALTFTHTHSAPKVNGASDNIFAEPIPPEHQAHIDQYTEELTNALESVILEAIQKMQPARLEWGTGSTGFAVNRRTAGGPTDHSLPVLVVRNGSDEITAIYTSYACHCVTLSHNLISGDWAGYAAASLERLFPNAVGMVSIGCGSDQNPSSGVTGDKTEIAEQQGVEIASEIQRLINYGLSPLSSDIHSSLNRIELEFNPLPTQSEYEALAAKGGAPGYNALTQLEKLRMGATLPTSLPYPIQTISFGDQLCMVFLAGEVCVDYSIRLRKHLNPEQLWIHGYSNDFGAYIPSERLVAEGGYGGGAEIPYFALPTTLKGGLEQRIVNEVMQQVPESFHIQEGTQGIPPKSPEESLKCMTTHDNLKIELVASEPLITDPVAIDFGLDGRLWVCQMNDYAHGVEEEFSESSEIRVLTDSDGDGRFDTATVFLDGLRYPTDVKVWRNGALICDAPNIIYAEDTDGDSKADVSRVLFSGFATHNGQARVNSLQWGLDHWLYGSSGLFGGRITNERGEIVDVTDRDFRLNPDTGMIEPVTGRTQQSRVRDDWGNWYGCDNSSLIRHYPVDEHYMRRNPFIRPAATSVSVPSGDNAGKLFPASNLVLFKLSGPAGAATAACGVGIYRDSLLGDDYSNNSFTCEPVNQLVYRQQLTRDGVVIRGQRAPNEQTTDFLTSTDRWFRPVQARTGPDGGLWIVDMYRYVIEHPRWIPDETLAELNVFSGNDRGRIYRVVPKNGRLHTWQHADTTQPALLAAALNTPNGTTRDLIQQKLAWEILPETDLPAVREELSRILTKSPWPAARLSALCTLNHLNLLSQDALQSALKDPHGEVRRHAVRLSESLLSQSETLRSIVLSLSDDPAPEVKLQLAYSLGNTDHPDAAPIIAKLALHSDNSWLTAAALSSLNTKNLPAVLKTILGSEGLPPQLRNDLIASAAGLADEDSVSEVFKSVLDTPGERRTWQYTAFADLLRGLDRRPLKSELWKDSTVAVQGKSMLDSARRLVSDSSDTEKIIGAISLLSGLNGPASTSILGQPEESDSLLLADKVSPQSPVSIQEAAIDALTRRGGLNDANSLLNCLSRTTPALRTRAIRGLLSRSSWKPLVVDALKSRALNADDLSAADREQLLNGLEGSVLDQATLLLTYGFSNRQQLVRDWQDVLRLPGNAADGRAVFNKRCSICHKLDNIGYDVGPNLAALTTRSGSFLLTAILDPNRDVDARYNSYVAALDDGRTVNGILISETSTSLTLREQEGREHVLLRNQIEEFRNTGRSAMPEGIEKDITKQQLADLITWLMELGPPPKSFTGNMPQTISADQNGQFILPASSAAIYGGDIAYESDSPFHNIGYWHGVNDAAAWTLTLEMEQTLDVWLDYSCHSDSAGNTLQIDGSSEPLLFVVQSTGGWDKYRPALIGRLTLPAGTHRLTLRPERSFRGPALLDLRTVALVPDGHSPPMAAASESIIRTDNPTQIAKLLLDDSVSQSDREQLIAQHPALSAELITEMAKGLGKADEEEYRRIPWIWRVAIAAGKRNDSKELLAILDASLPGTDQPLRDWQSVVVGGGIINGISQTGVWPRDRLDRLIAGNNDLSARWDHSIAQASIMSDNEMVRSGTRYDALRMIAMESFEVHGRQLVRYLSPCINDELQMGAISGLSDMAAADAGIAIAENIGHFSDYNRTLAVAALLRTTPRTQRLLKAIESQELTTEQIDQSTRNALRSHSDAIIRQKAVQLFPETE
ncbi:MAG: neutral/alkaline non-lysosomal ceramidase N-terminal domain-containing protein [Planctomyces sp.]|nr:neutral/alkaline non-lysosomal ceramidase N-terminal domain-containing protein [Planctomyces sp.]